MTKISDASGKQNLPVAAKPLRTPLRTAVIAIISSLIAFAFWPVVWTIFWYLFVYLPKPERGDYFAPTEYEKLDAYRYVLGWIFGVSLVVGVLVLLWKLAIIGAPADQTSGSGSENRALEKYR